MIRTVITGLALIVFYSPALFACPAGQSCPAGKDCVADSSLCVADTASSSAPTTVKDQLGLILDPDHHVQFEGTPPSSESETGFETGMSIRYYIDAQASVDVSMDFLFSHDVMNSPIPSETGWEWSSDIGAAKY